VFPNNYKEEEIRSLKKMLTPKNKEITSNKLETTEVHSCGGEQKIQLLQLFNEYS
jgi:hypothetical protein